eukprot:Tamp_10661.p1 GENE.Tamp_10661~~Tamp_10661.p1  ORF type:complete len:328 (+),score=56.42 Tamp_10661:143-1126(+)
MSQAPHLVFVLAGQSNMAGRGALAQALPACHQVMMLAGDDGQGQWREAQEPIFADVDGERLRTLGGSKSKKPCGTGPALFFAHHLISLIRASDEWAAVVKEECGEQAADDDARAMDKLSNLRIGLVPAAIGGTAIDAWVENAPLYEHLLKQTHRALSASTPAPPTAAGAPAAAAPASSGGPATLSASSEGESRPKLAAVLWHQGESDADTEERAESYGTKLRSMLRALRLALGSPAERLNVVVCGIWGSPERVPCKAAVRAAQLAVYHLAGQEEGAEGFVDTQDLEFQDDGLHLTAEGARILGERLAHAVTQLPCFPGILRSLAKCL